MDRHAFSVSFSPGKIDRDAGIIRGVAVMTEGIANGLVVDALTLQQVKTCSETYANGLKVVDRHTKGTDSVFATVGALKNFRIDGTKLVADLFTLKSEANTAKLMEMAETIPDTFGLSVAFSGLNEVVGGVAHARCAEIYNAALVDVPAANPSGLFSKNQAGDTPPAQIVPVDASKKDKAMATDIQPTLEARLEKLESAVTEMMTKMASVVKPAEPDADDTDMAEAKKAITELSAQVKTLTELSAKIADREAFAQTIAKEFSKHVGASAVITPAPVAGVVAVVELSAVEKFGALCAKHFAATKSKPAAVKLAMKEDPASYKAFTESGGNIKWA